MRCALAAPSALRGAQPRTVPQPRLCVAHAARGGRSISSSSISGSGTGPAGSEVLRLAQELLLSSSRAPRLNRREIEQLAQLVVAAARVTAARDAAARESAEKDVKLVRAHAQVQTLVAGILGMRGKMHALGLMDYAESWLFQDVDPGDGWDRKDMWSKLGSVNKELEDCIVDKTGWKAEWIPDKAARVYTHLSALEQSGNLPTATTTSRVPLVEGPLSREEMWFLECVANEVLCPVELWYQDQPAPSI